MFAFLLALAWKSSLLLLAAWGVAALLSRRSAALRHAVWTVAVAALFALPLVQAVAPPLPAPLPFKPRPAPAPGVVAQTVTKPAPAAPGALVPAAPRISAAPATPASRPLDRSVVVVFIWIVGAAVAFGYFAAGRLVLARLARSARAVEDPSWLALAADIAATLGIHRPVRLLVAADATAPMTWGATILLPARAEAWPETQRRAFLVHELAHVARRDCTIQDWAHVACAIYWFQPLAWLAAHRLRIEREPACDDLVLASGAGAEAYARQLLEVVRSARVPRGALSVSGAAMAAPSQLESRVKALLDGARDRRRVGRAGAIAAALVASALLLPLAAVVPAASKTKSVTKAPSGGSLDDRWEQALKESNATWFGYALQTDRVQEGEMLLSDSEGWDTGDLKKGDITLADRFSCGPDDAVILFHVAGGSFDRVAIRSAKLAPPKGGLIAVGVIPAEESFKFLAARLNEAPDDDRRAAVIVNALALHPSEPAVPFLVELLDGKRSGETRAQAAEGLARHPTKASLDALVSHANADRAIGVRREAAEAMGDLRMPEATKPLIELALHCDERLVQAEAVESLGAREPERVVAALVKIAREAPDEMVRREAVETLGDLQGPEGLQALRVLARSEDKAVRDEVAETLHDMAERAPKPR